ncbi:Ig-like domain-containing protein [Algibacillus agarilyticus]|uniref:Ig-like domain-containing protein n=1 Tax=Algibacillus agarilyticus TaxID=2234133 RepID=UPI0022B821FD|nr:Ig-like domain-containing protein [Algibacillus agarilyticus]
MPTIAITSSVPDLQSGETATLTFTLSESATNFTIDDITATGGSLGSLSGSGASYSAVFTPTVSSTTAASVSVAASTFNDAAGNANTVSNTLGLTVDTEVPTIAITSTSSALKSGETTTITFTLNETGASFAQSDITVSGGSLGSLSNSGNIYTATFTPTASSTTAGSISVAANTFTDAAGNANTVSNTLGLTIDTVVPTISIVSSDSTLQSGETSTLTFTLSESATDFTIGDITVTGGTLGSLSGSGSSYSAVFTPTASSTTAGSISVAANTFNDAAGNANTVSNTVALTVDTLAPTITITADDAALKIGEVANLTFTASEDITGFDQSDIAFSTGSLSNFTGSGSVYTATFTPNVTSNTLVSINIASNTYHDGFNNANTDSADLTISVNTSIPTISISSNDLQLVIGDTATLTFTLSENSTDFTASDITVTGGTLSNFSGSDTSYTASFEPSANSTTSATINVSANVFTDSASNNNSAATELSLAVETTIPTVTITTNDSALKTNETATLTFTLSESSSDFTNSDIVVTGGELSSFSGSENTYTAIFTPSLASVENATVNVAANLFTDQAGNQNSAANELSFNVDTIIPTIAITTTSTDLKIDSTSTLTFTLSEDSSDFISSDITVTGGTISDLTGSGASYTAIFTPTLSSTTSGEITVNASQFTDAAGNENTASNTVSINIDTIQPTVTITSDDAALITDDIATITFTLSEASTDFTAADITVAGGTLSSFAGSATTYTASFTPTASSTTNATIDIAASQFTDAAGNNNAAASQISMTVDTIKPTITVSTDDSALKIGDVANITFTLSEASTDFVEADITTTGGTLTDFTGSGTSYTASFTPTTDSTVDATIDIAVNTFTDAAGNDNTAATTLNMVVDTLAPTISVTTNDTALKTDDVATLTFTLSETSTDFTENDITVTGGTLSAFTGTDNIYTASFTPTASSVVSATIDVAASVFTDAAGNDNSAAAQLNLGVDTTTPSVLITSNDNELNANEVATLTFTLSEITTDFTAEDITVTGGELSSFNGSGIDYTATFTPAESSNENGTINVAANTFVDAAGNGNSAATTLSLTIDTIAPTVTISSNNTALKSGEVATLTFTLSEESTNFVGTDITFTGGTLSDFTGSGSSYSANFTPTTSSVVSATIDIAANTFTDAAGNNNTAATQFNLGIDTTAPTVAITTNDNALKIGDVASLTFTLSETSTDFTEADITTSGGSLSAFSGSGVNYTASFTPSENSTETAIINVSATLFTDTAGNSNTTAAQLSLSVDTLAPTITVTSDDDALKTGDVATLTFTLSEGSSNFVETDINVTGGVLSDFAGSDSLYTASFTPTESSIVNATIDIAANAFTDAADNNNTAATQLSINVDTVAPTLTSSSPQHQVTAINVNSFKATLTFNEDVQLAQTSDIISLILLSDSSTVESISSDAISINGSEVLATFSQTLLPNVSYGLLISNSVITDLSGNAFAGIASNELNFSTSNEAPIATADSTTTAEDNAIQIDVLANDNDQEGFLQAASVTLVTEPTKGSTSINTANGVITYTPFSNQTGSDSFTYTVADQQGSVSNETNVAITITAVNDLPIANNDTASTAEDTAVIIDVTADDTDVEDAKPTGEITITVDAANGSATVVDGQITYTPNANFNGSDTFNYQVADSEGGVSNAALVTVSVSSSNDVPVAVNDTATTDEDTAVTFTVLNNDTDIEDMSFDATQLTVVNTPTNGTVVINTDSTLTYTPTANTNGTDTFTYTITDSDSGVSNEASVTITINAVNDAPIAVDNSVSNVSEDTVYIINVLGNDSDIDSELLPESVTIKTAPENGTATVNSDGHIEYLPSNNYSGNDVLTYTIKDSDDLESNIATVNLTVLAVNDAPLANNDGPITLNEDGVVTIDVLSNDSDVDGTLDETQVTITTAPLFGTAVVNSDGTVTYTPNKNVNGSDSFTYSVVDDQGLAVENDATVEIQITPVNDAPTATNDTDILFDEDTVAIINLINNDSDIDSNLDNTSIKIVTQAQLGVVTINDDGTITYTPDSNENGADTFTYTVQDEEGLASAAATVSLTIAAVNDAPTIAGTANTSVNEDTLYTFTPTGSDIDSENLSYKVENLPSWAIFDTNTGQITGTPGNDNVGNFTDITISINDDELTTTLTPFTIAVNNVNDAPFISAKLDNISSTEDDAFTYTFDSGLFSDVDTNDQLTVSVTNLPSWLNFDSSSLTFSGTPNNDNVGTQTLNVSVSDLSGVAVNDEITLTVTNTNDTPIANADTFTLDEGASVIITPDMGVLVNDNDVDSQDTLSAVLLSQPAFASDFIFNSNGSFSYTHNGSEINTDSFTYQATDGTASSDIVTVSINLNDVNDQPTFTSTLNNLEYLQGSRISYSVSTFDADNQVALTLQSAPDWLTLSTSNQLSGDVPFNFVGDTQVSLLASDGELETEQNFTITVVEGTLATVALTTAWDLTSAIVEEPVTLTLSTQLNTAIELSDGTVITQLNGNVSINSLPENCTAAESVISCSLSLLTSEQNNIDITVTPNAIGDLLATISVLDNESNNTLTIQSTDINVSVIAINVSNEAFALEDATSIAVADIISTSENSEFVAGTSLEQPIQILSSETDNINNVLATIDNLGNTIKIFAHDFDNDSIIDVLAINDSGEDSAHYRNNSDGTFTLVTSTPLGTSIGAYIVDFNADGFTDLVTFTEGQINFFRNNAGSFSTIPSIVNWNDSIIKEVVLSDINNDNIDDLIIGMGEKLQTLFGFGTLLSSSTQARPVHEVRAAAHIQTSILDISSLLSTEIAVDSLNDLKVADIDNDGVNDIVIVNNTQVSDSQVIEVAAVNIITYQQAEDKLSVIESFGTADSHSVEISDLNNDGSLDLLVGNANGVYQIYKRNEQSSEQSYDLADEVISESGSIVITADIDGDNISDVVAYNESTSQLNLYVSTDGNFISLSDINLALTKSNIALEVNSAAINNQVTVLNNGPLKATNVVVSFNYEGSAVQLTFDDEHCSYTSIHQADCIFATLANQQSIEIDYTVFANATTDQDVIVTVTQDQVDSTLTDNTANLILDINNKPIAIEDVATTNNRTSITVDVLSNDSDSDNDNIVLESAVANSGSVSITSDNRLTYTPDPSFIGQATITYIINDGRGGQDHNTVAVTVERYEEVNVKSGGSTSWFILYLLMLSLLIRNRTLSVIR